MVGSRGENSWFSEGGPLGVQAREVSLPLRVEEGPVNGTFLEAGRKCGSAQFVWVVDVHRLGSFGEGDWVNVVPSTSWSALDGVVTRFLRFARCGSDQERHFLECAHLGKTRSLVAVVSRAFCSWCVASVDGIGHVVNVPFQKVPWRSGH